MNNFLESKRDKYQAGLRVSAGILGVLVAVCIGYVPQHELYAVTDMPPIDTEVAPIVDETHGSSTIFMPDTGLPATTTKQQLPGQSDLFTSSTTATNTIEMKILPVAVVAKIAAETAVQDCGEIYSWLVHSRTESLVEARTPIIDCDDPFMVETEKPDYAYQLSIDRMDISEGVNVVLDGTKPRTRIDLELVHNVSRMNGNWSLRLYLQTDNGFEQVFHRYFTSNFQHIWHIPQLPAGEYQVVVQFNPLQYIHTLTQHDNMQLTTQSLSLVYDPVEPEAQVGASSVLFLPGIQSTRLQQDEFLFDEELWPPSINGGDVTELQMTNRGESVNEIYVKPEEVIDRVSYPGTADIVVYDGFIEYLDRAEVAGDISSWYAFAYDWRYQVESVVSEGVRLKGDDRLSLLNQLKAEADAASNGKVTIIAHSNGGLLAKALMNELERRCVNEDYQWCPETLIDRVIFVGSPQLGTPKAIQSLLHGDTVQGLQNIVFSQAEFRNTAINFPAAYDLLPSFEYFNAWEGEPIITFSEETPLGELFTKEYPDGVVNARDFQEFLYGNEGRVEPAAKEVNVPLTVNGLLMKGTDKRALNQFFWRAPAGVGVYEIVGVGQPTQRGLSYEPFPVESCTLKYFFCEAETILKPVPKTSLYGDETVMAISASGYKGSKQTLYFDMEEYNRFAEDKDLVGVTHANLTNPTEMHELFTNVITGKENELPRFLSLDIPDFSQITLDEHSVHSPATLLVKNSAGQQSGLEWTAAGFLIHEEIPNSSVLFLGGSTYVYVPPGDDYHITVSAYESGVVSLMLRTVAGAGETSLIESLRGISVATSSVLTYISTEEGLSDVVHLVSPNASTAIQSTWAGETTEVPYVSSEVSPAEELTADGEVSVPILENEDTQQTAQATRIADRTPARPNPQVQGVSISQLTPQWQEVYQALVLLQQVLSEMNQSMDNTQ